MPDLKVRAPLAGRRPDDDARHALAACRRGDAQGTQRGAAVAIDPQTGDVLVLVSRPGFDPNLFGRGLTRAEFKALNDNIDHPLLNRALRGQYPSGSTIKPGHRAARGSSTNNVNPDATTLLQRRLAPARQQPHRSAKAAPAGTARWTCATRSPSPATCTSTISPARSAWTTSPSFLAPLGFGSRHRHRHQRREAGPAALDASGRRRLSSAPPSRCGTPARR